MIQSRVGTIDYDDTKDGCEKNRDVIQEIRREDIMLFDPTKMTLRDAKYCFVKTHAEGTEDRHDLC